MDATRAGALALFDFLAHLYDGLPIWAIPIFWIALVLVLLSTISLVVLAARAQRENRNGRRETDTIGKENAEGNESDYLWVFMVPALNEEITITDSVMRLSEVQVTHSRILVINDGSTDRTGEILAGLSESIPQLTVLTRVPPDAQRGKSDALNNAWRYVHDVVLGQGQYEGWDPSQVIVTIVDADGRLDPEAGKVTRHFNNPRVGGVQSQVRIYNRNGLLTYAQDLEFGIFGTVFQLGRTSWGTANMGGNGQFNRLAALDSVAVEDAFGRAGPWRGGRLTEDQDIGLRLMHNGWSGEQSSEVSINQQGLHSLRLLFRQRTRWSQGAWQVLDQIGPSLRNKELGFVAKIDQLGYLLIPIIQVWVGLSVVLSASFLILGISQPRWTITLLVLLYVFSALPGIFGVFMARRNQGIAAFFTNLLFAHLYLVYSWMIYPVVYRALFRHVVGSNSWAKTKREEIEPAEQTN